MFRAFNDHYSIGYTKEEINAKCFMYIPIKLSFMSFAYVFDKGEYGYEF